MSFTQGTGTAYPSTRSTSASRREQTALDAGSAFNAHDAWMASCPGADSGPPYAVKGASHAHDRIEERTPLHKGNIEPLQRAVDFLGLSPGSYHLPLRGKDGQVLGYAQFKGVPNRKGPVLATVLAPHMKPGGTNLEAWTKQAALATNTSPRASGLFDTDQTASLPPEALGWNGTHATVGRQESTGYALRRAFEDVNHATNGTMEYGVNQP